MRQVNSNMEYNEYYDSDLNNDGRADTNRDPSGLNTIKQNTQYYQKTEKTQGTKQFKKTNTLWTNHQNEENLPDLMQDSEDCGTQKVNSNMNNFGFIKTHTMGTMGGQQKYMGNQSPLQTQQNFIGGQRVSLGNQQMVGVNQPQRTTSQYYVNTQTGVYRQSMPSGSNLNNNEYTTVGYTQNDGSHKKFSLLEQQIEGLYQEGVTGRMSAKLRCKNCDQLIQTIVKFEPRQYSQNKPNQIIRMNRKQYMHQLQIILFKILVKQQIFVQLFYVFQLVHCVVFLIYQTNVKMLYIIVQIVKNIIKITYLSGVVVGVKKF